VAGRVSQGVPAFLVPLAIVVPLTIVFARIFAATFETPFRRRRSSPVVGARLPRPQPVPA
jgi:peptidoglycan/LPS O-acetylase OafA/YrhL